MIGGLTWQLFIITTFIMGTSIFVLYTRNTIYCLLSLISLVLSLSWFLIYAGLELIGFMLSIIYLGAILIFFIFVIMLIDLRFEDLQEIYDDARTYEPQGLTTLYPITMLGSMFTLNIYLERILYAEFYGLEKLITPDDLTGLDPLAFDLLTEYFTSQTSSPVAIGFFLFSTEGTTVGLVSLLILFSLYLSLFTVQNANEEVMLRLEAKTLKDANKKSN